MKFDFYLADVSCRLEMALESEQEKRNETANSSVVSEQRQREKSSFSVFEVHRIIKKCIFERK